ncbi:MAG: CoA-binding protein [Holophagaceae bacterium]
MTAWQDILRMANSVVVVGLSAKPWRASYSVAKYLKNSGYLIYGVNPELTYPISGIPIYKSLSEVSQVDVINVFRKSEDLEELVDDICILPWTPKICWFQLNMKLQPHEEYRLNKKGILVVKDKCLMVEHRLMY